MHLLRTFSVLALASILASPAFAIIEYRFQSPKTTSTQGSVTQRGRQDTIWVTAVSHSIVSPRDPASGLPSGKRMHKPAVFFSKSVDANSPALTGAMEGKVEFSRVEVVEDGVLLATLNLVRIASIQIKDGKKTVTLQYSTIDWKD